MTDLPLVVQQLLHQNHDEGTVYHDYEAGYHDNETDGNDSVMEDYEEDCHAENRGNISFYVLKKKV